MKTKTLVRNQVYCSNNKSAAEYLIEIIRLEKHDTALEILEIALNAAEYKGKATPEALRSAIDTTWKMLNG